MIDTKDRADEFELEPSEYYLTEFNDFRSHDGYFRKYRVWRIGEETIQNHMFIHDDWNVHGTSRLDTMIKHGWMLLEEPVFLEKPLDRRISALVGEIARITGLEYFGIDYGYLADGTPVFFEANATMRSHYPDWYSQFPYVEEVGRRHVRLFQELIAGKAVR